MRPLRFQIEPRDPLQDRRPHNNDLPNLQLLCKNCHRYKTHGWKKKKKIRQTVNESSNGSVGTVKVQPRHAGGFHVTVPISVARKLGLKPKEMVEVFVDFEEKEIIYKFTEYLKHSPKLIKIGNRVGMTIPEHLLKGLNWKEGDIVEVGVDNGSMIVTKRVD